VSRESRSTAGVITGTPKQSFVASSRRQGGHGGESMIIPGRDPLGEDKTNVEGLARPGEARLPYRERRVAFDERRLRS
jgi:hypothetical protein